MTINEWVRIRANDLSLFMVSWDNFNLLFGESRFPHDLPEQDWEYQFKSFIEKHYEDKVKLGYTEKVS